MNKLTQLRTIIASLDETLVKAFCERATFKVNADLYQHITPALCVAETATCFRTASTMASRTHIIRSLYVHTLLPLLCDSGLNEDRRKCIAVDTACITALAQRLNLSVHVASLKMEEISESLRLPLQLHDPELMEQAITNHAVEAEVIDHILTMSHKRHTQDVLAQKIGSIYEQWLIPISRKIQVNGLLALPYSR